MANKYMHADNHHPNENNIESPLSDRVEKMDATIGREALRVPAFLGDAAYNVGKSIKNKLTS